MKKICLFLSIIALFVFSQGNVFSAAFQLEKIGVLSTDGKTYGKWWYTVKNPTLSGSSSAGTSITLKVDDQTNTFKADSSGKWAYTPSNLDDGDHNIALTSSDGNYSFVLHIGQDLPATFGDTSKGSTPSQTTSSVPSTGSNQVIGVIIGTSLVALAYYLYTKNNNKAFEKNVFKDLNK